MYLKGFLGVFLIGAYYLFVFSPKGENGFVSCAKKIGI